MSSTRAEFSPDFFRSLFGASKTEWEDFLDVSIRAVEEAKDKLTAAVAGSDQQGLSEARHGIGPSLTQWGAVSLESSLRQLHVDSPSSWDALSAEFDVLLACLRGLKAD